PPRVREDTLLNDDERSAAGGAVELRRDRLGEEHRAFLLALAAAPERTISYPRASLRDQRKNLPSAWFRASASVMAGREILTRDVEELAPSAWFTPVASFHSALEGTATPVSAGEYELRELL